MTNTIQTRQGEPGKTPYQRAVELGLFTGTEAEYNASLQGENGPPGNDGSPDTPQQVADKYHQVANEFTDVDVTNLSNVRTQAQANENAIDDLGTASVADLGTAIGNVPALINVLGEAGLPAVDGSRLIGVVAFPFIVSLIDADNDGSFTFRGGAQDGDGYIVRRSKADQSQTQAGPFPIAELNTRFANRANEVYA